MSAAYRNTSPLRRTRAEIARKWWIARDDLIREDPDDVFRMGRVDAFVESWSILYREGKKDRTGREKPIARVLIRGVIDGMQRELQREHSVGDCDLRDWIPKLCRAVDTIEEELSK